MLVGILVITVGVHGDYVLSNSVEDMIDYSNHIVKGQFGDLVDTNVMSSNQGNPDEPSPIQNVQRIYEFHIFEVIDGQIEEETIYISRSYLDIYEIYTDSTETIEIPFEFYFEPDPTAEVVVFLTELERDGLFAFSTEPAMFTVEEDGTLQIQSTTVNLSPPEFETYTTDKGDRVELDMTVPQTEDNFSGITEEELVNLIE